MKNITIAGNIGQKDAVTRQAGSGTVTGFSVAVSGRRRDDPSTWFDVSIWGARGEKLAGYLTKGTKVVVSGELKTREHDGKTYLGVDASDVTLMGGGERRDAAPAQSEPQGGGYGSLDGDDIPFAACTL